MTISTAFRRGGIGSRLARYGSPNFVRLYAIGACVALLSGLVISYLGLVAHGNAGIMQTDFVSYYGAEHLVVSGHGAHIYDLSALGHYERALVHPLTVRNGVLPYVYPPYLALLMVPLGAPSYALAWYIWLGFNVLLILFTIAGLQRYLELRRGSAVLLWAAGLSFLPIFVALAQGQTSILLLALLTASFLAARSEHQPVAGVLLAMALIKPQYVVPVLLVLAIRRYWTTMIAFTVSCAVLFIVPMAALGVNIDLNYIHMLQSAGGWHGQFGYTPAMNQSLWGFTQLLFPSAIATPLTLVIGFAILAGLAHATYRFPALDIPWGLATVIAVILSPHVLIHDLSLLLLPAAILLSFRGDSLPYVGPLLVLGDAAMLLGSRVVAALPVQLSVLAMLALAVWLYRVKSASRTDSVQFEPVPHYPSPKSRPRRLLEDA